MADSVPLMVSLLSGGVAGTAVDIALFPLDTIKTRLQSPRGFYASGGFSRIYAGLGPAALGSAPNAALFFLAYNAVKSTEILQKRHEAFRHAIAASAGEVTACLVRVPVEIIKQRRQAFQNVEPSLSSTSIVKKILHSKGFLGLYRGYFTTVSREVPFSIIQFPLWEYFKHKYALNFNAEASPGVSASFGAVSGGIAAGLTTPLDVAKTRIMLSDDPSTKRTLVVLRDIFVVNGFRGLFAGIVPRTMWMSIGGFIFFGAYEGVKDVLIRK